MKLITQRQLIQGVAAKWRAQYKGSMDTRLFDGSSKGEIAEQLDALDRDKACAEDVAKIIGNNSWTRMTCDECKRDVDAVLRVGAEPDYESATAYLCFECVQKAMGVEWPNDKSSATRPTGGAS